MEATQPSSRMPNSSPFAPSEPFPPPYEPPAILAQGKLEFRAGSPTDQPLDQFLNPGNPLSSS
jgi:hypothetical protein